MRPRSSAWASQSGALVLAALAASTPAHAQTAAGSSGPPVEILLTIAGAFVLVIGLVGFFVVRQWRTARASRSWPVAAGTVLSGEIKAVTERSSDGETTISVPHLRYAYEVDGRRFEGERIRFGRIRESERGARKILERYPVGAGVEVRYDPANPAEATLESKAGIGLMVFALVALTGLFLYMLSVFLG